jgi:hypothetical protein
MFRKFAYQQAGEGQRAWNWCPSVHSTCRYQFEPALALLSFLDQGSKAAVEE